MAIAWYYEVDTLKTCLRPSKLSPGSFFQFNQEGTKILLVQVRCLQTNRRQRNRPSPRGGRTRGGLPKNLKVGDARHHLCISLVTEFSSRQSLFIPLESVGKYEFTSNKDLKIKKFDLENFRGVDSLELEVG